MHRGPQKRVYTDVMHKTYQVSLDHRVWLRGNILYDINYNYMQACMQPAACLIQTVGSSIKQLTKTRVNINTCLHDKQTQIKTLHNFIIIIINNSDVAGMENHAPRVSKDTFPPQAPVFTAQCSLVHLRGLGIACRPSVCNVGGLWSHRLEILETNCTDN